MTKYPSQIDTSATLPLVVDNSSPIGGDTINRLRNAIVAVEKELGVKPSGTYTTVRARLDAMDAFLAGFNSNVTLNVLPTSVTLPSEVVFLAGDGYCATSNPTRVGARSIDMDKFPRTYPDNRTRTIKFKAELEVTNAATDGYVQIKDITHNAIIINSLLTTNSLSPTELSVILDTNILDGYLREDGYCDQVIYEAQIYLIGGNGTSDQVICRNARLEFTYSLPIVVSALVALALPIDLNFICGTTLNGFTTAARVGGRTIDMAGFPVVISTADARVRTAKFYANVEVSAPGVDGYLQLYDTTHHVLVTGTYFHFTNTISDEYSVTLTVGSGTGNLRNDAATRYEIRMWKISGSPADRVICNNARITITYE